MEPPPFALMYLPIESMSDVLFAMLVCSRVDQLQVCNISTKDPFTVDFVIPFQSSLQVMFHFSGPSASQMFGGH